ncbi:hypothetical protein CWE08_09170 [Aliidiomarina iranensis]|uniref:ABC transporter domain-containing protein n=1 Tax=Aliidiomarina iranensis TaxID=1434071 RepID=A0A432VT56_9GAMM|nr:ABC transporter ATP-binding protein [Aliidiomarina iranensis]RUO19595.1 hypothetical protein CWE08_09170 [Aliidiomarina iranensis]
MSQSRNTNAISFSNLNFAYNNRGILSDISLQFETGKVTGIFGENGAGKSTLLKILAGVMSAEQIKASELQNFPQADIGYLGQQITPAWALKVSALVELGTLSRESWSREEKQAAVQEAMAQTDCLHLAERKVLEISTGELQRALLARVFAGKPKIILADEPTAGLDPRHQLAVMNLLQQHAQNGGTVLVVMHDLAAGKTFCDNAVLLANGKVYAHGTATEVLSDENIFDVFGV